MNKNILFVSLTAIVITISAGYYFFSQNIVVVPDISSQKDIKNDVLDISVDNIEQSIISATSSEESEQYSEALVVDENDIRYKYIKKIIDLSLKDEYFQPKNVIEEEERFRIFLAKQGGKVFYYKGAKDQKIEFIMNNAVCAKTPFVNEKEIFDLLLSGEQGDMTGQAWANTKDKVVCSNNYQLIIENKNEKEYKYQGTCCAQYSNDFDLSTPLRNDLKIKKIIDGYIAAAEKIKLIAPDFTYSVLYWKGFEHRYDFNQVIKDSDSDYIDSICFEYIRPKFYNKDIDAKINNLLEQINNYMKDWKYNSHMQGDATVSGFSGYFSEKEKMFVINYSHWVYNEPSYTSSETFCLGYYLHTPVINPLQ